MAQPLSPASSAPAPAAVRDATGAAPGGAAPRVAAPQLVTARSTGVSADDVFQGGARLAGGIIIVALVAIFLLLAWDSKEALGRFGFSFFTTSTWDNVKQQFGILPYIYGTLMTSAVAIVLGVPVAIGAALYVAEYCPTRLRTPISFSVELLAAIPSIIYGLWGFFVLSPFMRAYVEPFLNSTLGRLPVVGVLFSGNPIGKDLFTGGVILAIMILPTVMAVSREVILAVPPAQREGMLALGATRWETITQAVLPYARSGIAGAAILGLARALGETMAVTMVIGNSSRAITGSLYTPGYTMASAIANQFNEADNPLYFSAITGVAFALLLIAGVVNMIARLLIWQVQGGRGTVKAVV
jgi:phosphate transport system permease protein